VVIGCNLHVDSSAEKLGKRFFLIRQLAQVHSEFLPKREQAVNSHHDIMALPSLKSVQFLARAIFDKVFSQRLNTHAMKVYLLLCN